MFELFGSASCQFTGELREWLEWNDKEFVEYDVEADLDALRRMHALTDAQGMIPVLVDDGRVIQIGWQGRGCVVNTAAAASQVRGSARSHAGRQPPIRED